MVAGVANQRHAHDFHFACKTQTAEGSAATLTSGSAFKITSFTPANEVAELLKPGSTGTREHLSTEVVDGILTPRFTVAGVMGYGTDILADNEAMAALLEGAMGTRGTSGGAVTFTYANTLPFLTCAVKEKASQYTLYTDCQVTSLELESNKDDQVTFSAELVAKSVASGTSTFTAPDPPNVGAPWIHAAQLTATSKGLEQAASRVKVSIANNIEPIHTVARTPTALRFSGKQDVLVEMDVIPDDKHQQFVTDALAFDQELDGTTFIWANAGNSKNLEATFGVLKRTSPTGHQEIADGALGEALTLSFRAVNDAANDKAALKLAHTS